MFSLCLRSQSQCVRKQLQNKNISALRTLLSECYIAPPATKQASYISEAEPGAPNLVTQCLSLDHCIERGYPITSSMIDRMVLGIEDKEHLEGSLYYLYKYRFSRNGYFLRPWTVHAFMKKCIGIDISPVMTTLKQKQYYGLFPDHYSLQLLANHFLKEGHINDAFAIIVQMFLLEQFDNRVSQVLAIDVVSKYLAEHSDDGILTEFNDVETQRNVAAVLFSAGMSIESTSLTLIGKCLLGKIEEQHSLQEVFQDPWGPLHWERGYLQRCLDDLETINEPVSQECIDVMKSAVENNDIFKERLANTIDNLQSKGLISGDTSLTINGVASALVGQLPEREEAELENFQKLLQSWVDDKQTIADIENEIILEYRKEREEAFHEEKLQERAHKMAVEASGFWDLLKDADAEKSVEGLANHLHPGYVEGSMDELNVLERFRQRKNILVDPVILMS